MTAQIPEYTISRRVHAIWKKLSDWYGADVIAKHHGAIPPREWCACIDSVDSRKQMDQILSTMRHAHPTFPPRFPEFEAIVNRTLRPPSAVNPVDVLEQELRARGLDRPGRRRSYFGPNGSVRGVLLEGDEHYPEVRITLDDCVQTSAPAIQPDPRRS